METKIIDSKRTDNCIVELFEFCNKDGTIIKYSVVKSCIGINTVSGAAKIEEKSFSNKERAINNFNNQK